MPISYATLGREKKLSTLAARLYRIEQGPNRAALLKRAEAALLRANPHLREVEGFRKGRIVVVPGDVGLKPTDRVTTTRPGKLDGTLEEADTRFKLAGQTLESAFDSGAKQSEKILAQLSDRNVASQIRMALPSSTPILKKARETIEKDEKDAQKQRDRIAKAVKSAQEEIARLMALAETLKSGEG